MRFDVSIDDPEMNELFTLARAKGLWFWSHYQGIWFSPDELIRLRAEGRFRWGAQNWELRNPEEYLEETRRRVTEAQMAHARAVKRVIESRPQQETRR